MRIRGIRAALAMGLFVSVAWAGSFALWSDDESSATSFATGLVDISLGSGTVDFAATKMAPGDEVYGAVTVQNSSAANALQVKYNMSTTIDSGASLAGALNAEVRAVSGACTAASFADSTDVMGGGAATLLSGLSISTWRTLDPGTSEVACFKVSLPLSDTASEDLSTSATFNFHAEQTANNT